MAKRGHGRNNDALQVSSSKGEGGDVPLAFDSLLTRVIWAQESFLTVKRSGTMAVDM